MFKRLLLLLAFLPFSVAAFGQFQPQYDPHLNLGNPGQDEDFLQSSMKYTTAEVEWSKIAVQKSSNPDVKALATETVNDETTIAGLLVSEAKSRKMKVPSGTSGKEKKTSDKLNGLSGADFDKEYLSALVKTQHDDIGAMREEAKASKDSSMQNFATKTGDQETARNDKAKTLLKQLGGK